MGIFKILNESCSAAFSDGKKSAIRILSDWKMQIFKTIKKTNPNLNRLISLQFWVIFDEGQSTPPPRIHIFL